MRVKVKNAESWTCKVKWGKNEVKGKTVKEKEQTIYFEKLPVGQYKVTIEVEETIGKKRKGKKEVEFTITKVPKLPLENDDIDQQDQQEQGSDSNDNIHLQDDLNENNKKALDVDIKYKIKYVEGDEVKLNVTVKNVSGAWEYSAVLKNNPKVKGSVKSGKKKTISLGNLPVGQYKVTIEVEETKEKRRKGNKEITFEVIKKDPTSPPEIYSENVNKLEKGYAKIHRVIMDNDINGLKELFNNPYLNLNIISTHGESETPLIMASRQGNKEIFDLLRNKGVSVNFSYRNKGIYELLLFPQCPSDREISTSMEGRYQIFIELVQEGVVPIIFSSNNNNKKDLIHLACFGGNIKLVKYLLSKNVDINKKDEELRTPFFLAVNNYFPEIAKILLAKDSTNFDDPASTGYTPIYYAVKSRNKEMVKTLVDMDADVNREYKIESNGTILHSMFALKSLLNNDDLEILNILLGAKGVDIRKKDKKGREPLVMALDNEDSKAMSLFMKFGLVSSAAKEQLIKLVEQNFEEDKKAEMLKVLNEDKGIVGWIKKIFG